MHDDELITRHAVVRYRERIEDAPYSVIRSRLLTAEVRRACEVSRVTGSSLRVKRPDVTAIISNGCIVTVVSGGTAGGQRDNGYHGPTSAHWKRQPFRRRPGAWKQHLVREGII